MSVGDTSSSEVTITTAIVRTLVAGQFPQWADLPVEPVGTQGVDNATYRLGDAMSVRLPRFARWEGQVHREQHWLPRLAPHLPLPISVPLAQGVPAAGFPFPWSVYRWLDGERATRENLDPRHAGVDLARFLAALRRIDAADGPPPEWSNGFRGVHLADERDSPVVRTRIRPKIADLDGLVDTDAVTAVWESALAAPLWAGPPVWLHGDPAPGNLLSIDGRLSAVIDFGTMAVGDPACDLIGAWTLLTPEGRTAFRATCPLDDATWARGRGWGLAALLPVPADLTGPDAAPRRARLDELVADHRRD